LTVLSTVLKLKLEKDGQRIWLQTIQGVSYEVRVI